MAAIPPNCDPCKLWMGDLESSMDEAFIRKAFDELRYEVVSIKMGKSQGVGQSPRYCFLEFPSTMHAREVLEKLNQQIIPGTNHTRRFKLNWASKPVDSGTLEYHAYVGNLSFDVTAQELLEFFQKNYSSVRLVRIVEDEKGCSKGYGFVRFLDPEERDRCINELDGFTFVGNKPVSVKKANPQQGQDMMSGDLDPLTYSFGGYPYGGSVGAYTAANLYGYYSQYGSTAVGNEQLPFNGLPLQDQSVVQAVSASPLPPQPPMTSPPQPDEGTPTRATGAPTVRTEAEDSIEQANAELFSVERRLFQEMQKTKWNILYLSALKLQ